MGFKNQPNTQSITVLAYVLKVSRTNADGSKTTEEIGAVQNINPSEERNVTESFEIGRSVSSGDTDLQIGEPFELVPGTVTRKSLEINRLALWSSEMYKIFGSSDVQTLSNQGNSFDIEEYRIAPGDSEYQPIRVYKNCYIKSYGSTRNISGGEVREIQRATISYQYVDQLLTAYSAV